MEDDLGFAHHRHDFTHTKGYAYMLLMQLLIIKYIYMYSVFSYKNIAISSLGYIF